MKVKELKEILNRTDRYDENNVVIKIHKPSFGPLRTCDVVGAHAGNDWDRGSFFLSTSLRLVVKSQKEDIYDMARDLLLFIATEPKKRSTYEKRTAVKILLRAGITEEDLVKYAPIFHRDKYEKAKV